jgi:type VI secretion system ImpM family protein
MDWLAHLLQGLVSRRLAAPLAIWGKVPSHTDFVSINTLMQDAQAWQAWVSHQWNPPSAIRPKERKAREEQGWMHLTPPPESRADLSQIPVAFMLPAPGLAGSQQYWRGVITTSRDRIGRPHPLIVYQRTSARWLQRRPTQRSETPSVDWQYTTPGVLSHDLLYWTARVMARWQAHHDSLHSLSQAVASLDRLHAPGLRQLLGDGPAPIAPAQLHDLVQGLGRDDELPDAMDGLEAVRSRPGARGGAQPPQNPSCGYWILDATGQRLRQAADWSQLWKSPQ